MCESKVGHQQGVATDHGRLMCVFAFVARGQPGSIASQIMERVPDIVLKINPQTAITDVTTFEDKKELYTEFKVDGK